MAKYPVRYLKGPGKSALIVFLTTTAKLPLSIECNNLTMHIKQKHRRAIETTSKIMPTTESLNPVS